MRVIGIVGGIASGKSAVAQRLAHWGAVVLNAEARIPLRGGLGAVAFLDGGNVWHTVSDMDLSQMRGSVGFGLRYRSPVGPIRIDLGFKLDRRMLPTGERERPTAFHISLGQAF